MSRHEHDWIPIVVAGRPAMTVATYGEHAENAARALNALVVADELPADAVAVDQLLHCREAVVDALRQRLYDLGQDDWYPPVDHLPARTPAPALAGLDEKLASLVDNIAFSLPSLPWDERRSPVEVLAEEATDPTVESWRAAAIELLAGSHALSAAEEQPWRTDPGAGWWVMRDVAVALEAVLVLDARLDEVGLLNDHHRPEYAMGLDEKRMVLSQTARIATWHATSASPEEATPRLRQVEPSAVLQPVALVGAPEDLAAAQRRLARFLKPMRANDAFFDDEPEITADAARQVTASQLYLCQVFAQAAEQSTRTRSLAAFFAERAEVLEELQPRIRYLAAVSDGRDPNKRTFWQQSELTTAVARMQDRGVAIRLQPPQMAELAKATHEVTHNLGKALRRELLRGNSHLIDADPRRRDGPARVNRRSPLEMTLTDLVNLPAPSEPAARFGNPLQRAALQQTLTMTPTTSARAPTPFPAARSVTYSAPAF
ncbi:hypothetical protein [Nocardioides sp. KR10-350]|uniref:hypothetical protein n=1 Tax=Nocardioides cheoyonin TaxID=3156615 RepID=UPI0032B5F101